MTEINKILEFNIRGFESYEYFFNSSMLRFRQVINILVWIKKNVFYFIYQSIKS